MLLLGIVLVSPGFDVCSSPAENPSTLGNATESCLGIDRHELTKGSWKVGSGKRVRNKSVVG